MSQHNSFQDLVKDIGWAVAGTVFLTIAGFILNVLIGNLFDEKGLGVYSLLATLYLAIGTLASAGLPGALTKYTTEFVDKPTVGCEFYAAALVLSIVFGLLGSAIMLTLRGWVGIVFNTPDLTQLLVIAALGLPIFELNKIVLARLRGLRQMRVFSIGESTRYLLLIVLTVGLVSWQGTLAAAVWALVLTELVLLAVLWCVTKIAQHLKVSNLGQRGRELSRFGSQILVSRLFVDLDARVGLLIIGYCLTPADVGIFAVAFMFAQALTVLPIALQKVTGPVITQNYVNGLSAPLGQFVNRTMQITVFLLTLVSIPLIVLFPQIIRLLYPGQNAFLAAQTAFNVLVVGFLFRGIAASVGSVFVSIGRPDIVLKVAPIRLLFNVVLSVALVGVFGISGVAAGTAATGLLTFSLWTVLMSRVIGIQIDYKPLIVIPALGVVALLITSLFSTILPVWVGLLLSLAAFSLVTIKSWRFDQYLGRLWRPNLKNNKI